MPTWMHQMSEMPELALDVQCLHRFMDITQLANTSSPTASLEALTTFSHLGGGSTGARPSADTVAAGMPDDGIPLRNGGTGAVGYAEAVGVYLGLATVP